MRINFNNVNNQNFGIANISKINSHHVTLPVKTLEDVYEKTDNLLDEFNDLIKLKRSIKKQILSLNNLIRRSPLAEVQKNCMFEIEDLKKEITNCDKNIAFVITDLKAMTEDIKQLQFYNNL